VFDEDGASVGIVGQGGKAFVRVAKDQGLLTVKWGSNDDASCRLQYGLQKDPEGDATPRLRHLDAGTCSANTRG
jgi:outer membrane usher protein